MMLMYIYIMTMNNNKSVPLFNINLLNKYMLNDSNLKSIIKSHIGNNNYNHNNKPDIQVVNKPDNENNDFFLPGDKDTLFWCFYIMKYGKEDYDMLPSRNIVVEKKLKIECITNMRENKLKLKSHKGMALSHAENSLLNEKAIDMQTFMSLCIIEGMSVMYLYKNTYYEMNLDTDEYTNIKTITRLDNPLKYGYEFKENCQNIRDTYYKVDNLNKPIKAMSSYKIDELLDFCNKLKIELKEGKKRKKDMYELLIQYFAL